MILVFGGTTEGKLVANTLDTRTINYFYSTKTKVDFKGKGRAIHGVMTVETLEQFCTTHNITHIINAAHPFASVLHKTIAALTLELPLLRYQRQFLDRIVHENVTYVDSFQEALLYFKTQKYKSLLALSGVQTISKLQAFWSHYTTWCRILDRDRSRAIAKTAGFPETHLLYGYPQSKAEETLLFSKLKPDVIFTKESGTNGKLSEKIHAAIALHIPIVILKKPKISNRYICIHTPEALVNQLP
jgi:cobalt-precorrin-5B (C1)-methyltransferase/precorrin-6A/cobalt-precorrin-6A reductase